MRKQGLTDDCLHVVFNSIICNMVLQCTRCLPGVAISLEIALIPFKRAFQEGFTLASNWR